MIGEQFESENIVAGLVLNLKPQFDKIAIWLKDGSDAVQVAKVKSDVCNILNNKGIELEYDVFKEKRDAPQGDKPNYKKGKFNKNKKDWGDKNAPVGGFARAADKAPAKEGEGNDAKPEEKS